MPPGNRTAVSSIDGSAPLEDEKRRARENILALSLCGR